MSEKILELRSVTKNFGNVLALQEVDLQVESGQITCILGDNGAGKSTLIKILSGSHKQDSGEFLIDGTPTELNTPRDALARGIATVFQDLATVPLMAIWRNFFLGNEPTKGWGPFKRIDIAKAKKVAREQLALMGIDIRDPEQAIGTLSGGERQAVVIARAIYFGARVVILDEPTSALGVKQAGVVLRYVLEAKARGIGVIFITHNPHHAYLVGDKFLILNRGKLINTFAKSEISSEQLIKAMAGGAELDALSHELSSTTKAQ